MSVKGIPDRPQALLVFHSHVTPHSRACQVHSRVWIPCPWTGILDFTKQSVVTKVHFMTQLVVIETVSVCQIICKFIWLQIKVYHKKIRSISVNEVILPSAGSINPSTHYHEVQNMAIFLGKYCQYGYDRQ